MAIYEYKAIDQLGNSIESIIEVNDEQELFKMLKKDNISLIRAKKSSISKLKKNKYKLLKKDEKITIKKIANLEITKQPIKPKDLSILTRQIQTMLSAGINIIDAFEILVEQLRNKRLKSAIINVIVDLKRGFSLSTSLKMHDDIFPTVFITIIESGELTGNLSGSLKSLTDFYENESIISAKVKKATLYPKIIGVITMLVIVLILTFIVPKFLPIFESSGVEIPKVTQSLLNLSDFLLANFIYISLFTLIFILIISKMLKYEKFKYIFDFIVNKIPIINTSVMKINTARFCRTLATLLNSGVPVVLSLKSAAAVSDNTIIIRGIDSITNEIKNGNSLSVMIGSLNYFSAVMISMIRVGEESGDIVGLLDKTADYYEQEMSESIDTLTGLIEPIMIVFLAVVVGYIALSILLPVLNMSQTVMAI